MNVCSESRPPSQVCSSLWLSPEAATGTTLIISLEKLCAYPSSTLTVPVGSAVCLVQSLAALAESPAFRSVPSSSPASFWRRWMGLFLPASKHAVLFAFFMKQNKNKTQPYFNHQLPLRFFAPLFSESPFTEIVILLVSYVLSTLFLRDLLRHNINTVNFNNCKCVKCDILTDQYSHVSKCYVSTTTDDIEHLHYPKKYTLAVNNFSPIPWTQEITDSFSHNRFTFSRIQYKWNHDVWSLFF